MKRVGIISLLHESNTFLAEPTTIDHFRSNLLCEGSEVISAYRGSHHEVGGFIEAMNGDTSIELCGIFAARAMPFGTITAGCWSELMDRMEQALRSCLPLDGLLVAPHGATVAESAPDADGDWLHRVRRIVGPDVPIVGTLDLHANVSRTMADSTDALFGYRTNPHLDQKARGLDAGHCLSRALQTGIRPRQCLIQLPLCINIERQATSEPHGVRLWQHADRIQSSPGMTGVSCLYGFPYSDVAEMGASVLAVATESVDCAQQAAHEMASIWWSARHDFSGQLISVDSAIQLAMNQRQRNSSAPVGLLEMGDNVGGGSPGDGTWIAHAWSRASSEPCLTVLADPEAVQSAVRAGVGNSFTLPVGGRIDPSRHGPALQDEWRVVHLSDGRFREAEPRHGGYSQFDQGPTAVICGVRTRVTVIATTLRVAPLSLQQVLSQNVRPQDFAMIVLKGVHAPVAAYAPVCSTLIRVNTPGATTADLSELSFAHRRHPMEPFETVTQANWNS